MTIVSTILAHAGDRTAAAFGDRQVSYAELAADIHRAAAYLRDCGLAGATIGIHLGPPQTETDYATWVAHLAALRVGAEHVSITKGAMLDRVIEAAKLDALLGTMPEDMTAKIGRLVPFPLASLPEAGESADNEAKAARLSLTSGSTGEPKLVRWDAATIEQRVAQAADVGDIGPDTRVGSMLGLRTTAGFRYPLATWCAGGCVLLANRVLDSHKRPALTRSNLFLCSPFQLGNLMKANREWPGKAERTVAVLGGRIPAALRDWALANLGKEILISYGSTETGNIAHGDAALASRHPGAVGWVRDGVEVRIVGDDGKPVAPGERGKVQVRSQSLTAPGEKRRKGSWFEPGDIGVMFEDGMLAIEGRDAEVINVGGMKIDAADIEAKLSAMPGIVDAGISPFDTAAGEAVAVALVVEGEAQLQQLLPNVRPLLPRGAEFRMFFIGEIPRNDMGKVDRPRLARAVTRVLAPSQARSRVDA